MTHFNKGPSYGLSAEVKNKVRDVAAGSSPGLCLHGGRSAAAGGSTRCGGAGGKDALTHPRGEERSAAGGRAARRRRRAPAADTCPPSPPLRSRPAGAAWAGPRRAFQPRDIMGTAGARPIGGGAAQSAPRPPRPAPPRPGTQRRGGGTGGVGSALRAAAENNGKIKKASTDVTCGRRAGSPV